MKNILMVMFAGFMTVVVTGCGSKVVNVVDKKHQLSHVCIEDNPKVKVDDFVPVVENVFNEWGISTEVYSKGAMPNYCITNMTYTALKSWDMSPYLSLAEVKLYKNKKQIGYAKYKLSGGSMSLDMSKWGSTESKMKPVLEELLSQYDKKEMAPPPKTIEKTESTNTNTSIDEKFKKLKKLHENGLITDEEYNAKRKELLDNY